MTSARTDRRRRRGVLTGACAVALAVIAGPPATAPAGARSEQRSGATVAPLPPPRPEALDGESGSEAAAPDPAPLPPPRPPPSELPAAVAAGSGASEETACRDRIRQLGVRFEPLAPLANGSCGATQPLKVSMLSDNVALEPPATMVCPVAEALGRWNQESVGPEAERHLQAKLAKIVIGTSYECRPQRNGAKISEHAFANAVDVMAVEVAGGRDLLVLGQAPDSPEGRFLAAIRASACTYFKTVLGPGSDAQHDDHLHVDLRDRKRGFRICQ